MYIILFIILAVLIISQNSRISKIEALLKEKKVDNRSSESAPTVSVIQNNTVTPVNPVTPIAPVVAPSIPLTSTNTPNVPKDISGEEVSGRILGRIGIAAVVIGMGFFLRYAFANNWVGPEGRVMIGILIGIVIMGIGQWLRAKYLQYSDLMMGGGLVVLYLSIFSAHALYHLVDPMVAFFGMFIVTAIGVLISIVNATMALSVLALIGGFLTPFLIGITTLDSWIIFTYITILNAGTLGISLYKRWPNLTLISLIGSVLYFGSWLFSSYEDTLMVPTLFFVLIQFLILNASSLIKIIKEKLQANEIDYIVLIGNALGFAFVCYYLLMPEYKHMVSIGSVGVALLYGVIALVAYKSNPTDRNINIFLPGLAVTFLTVAVPIEFSGPWIPAFWFAEALVLYAVASNSSSRGFQIMGAVVYVLGIIGLFSYLVEYSRKADFALFFNGPFMMVMFSVVIAYGIAFIYSKYGSITTDIQKNGVGIFVVVANVLTVYALTSQVIIYYDLQLALNSGNSESYTSIKNWSNISVSILWAIYAAILTAIGFAKRYSAVRRMGLVFFILTAIKIFTDVWSLGELYRVISFIAFGVIALTASFVYVKYRDRLKEIV